MDARVEEALGRSVIYEEHKGDFARACREAEAQLEQALASNDSVKSADDHLARGIVHMLQGEPAAAVAAVARVEALVPADANFRLLAHAYAMLATRVRYQIAPADSALMALEIQARWDLQAAASEEDRRLAELSARATDPATLLRTSLLFGPQRFAQAARYIVASRLQAVLLPLLSFRQQAEAQGAPPAWLAYTDRVVGDLCWRAGAGVATCWLTLSDRLAAPLSSPAVWNRLTVDGDWSNALAWVREAAELDRRHIQPSAARDAYAEAETLFQAAGAARGLGALQLRFGYPALLDGMYDQVVEHAARAQELFERSGDTLGTWLAQAHRALGMVGASRHADLTTAEAIGAWGREEGSFSFSLGLGLLLARTGRRWLLSDGDVERALICYRLAEALFERLGASDNAAQALGDQGTAYRLIGERARAMNLYEGVRERYAALIMERPSVATAAWQKALLVADEICAVYQEQQDADSLERSLARLLGLNAHPPSAGGEGLLGPRYADVLDTMVRLRSKLIAVLAPFFRAVAATQAGDAAAARPHFERALAAARAAGPDQRSLLEAAILRIWRRYPEVAAAFERYLEQGGAGTGFLGDLVGRMARDFGPAGAAEAGRQPQRTVELAALFFVRSRTYQLAREQLQALERLAGADWWARDQRPWEGLALYGEVAEGLDELPTALDHYERAIALLEARRGLLSRDAGKTALAGETGVRFLYFDAARAALRLATAAGTPDPLGEAAARAFAYAERGKARALLELLAAGRVGGAGAHPALTTLRAVNARLDLWHSLLARQRDEATPDPERLAQLAANITREEAELRRLEADLTASPTSLVQGRVLSLAEVSALLPPGVALLYYYFLSDDLLVWAITRQGMVVAHQETLDTYVLGRDIRAFHRACARADPSNHLGAELARTLLSPFAEVIRANRSLIIVPHGVAHTLPFHALSWEGEPLAASHTLTYLPNASPLPFLRPAQWGNQERVLAIGNPARMTYQPPLGGPETAAPALPDAEQEAVTVGALFPRSLVLLGEQAKAEAVRGKLRGFPIVHLATHGYLSEDAPLLSSVLLADGGALSVADLLALRLDADLVVLSACNTAQGQTTGGDDVLGLTRGLLAAGAAAAVVSLWPVNDASTGLLMGEFYRRLRAGVAPAPALRAAQRWLRTATVAQLGLAEHLRGRYDASGGRDVDALRWLRYYRACPDAIPFADPYYWAPFVSVGAVTRGP